MIYSWIWVALIVICAALAILTRKNIFIALAISPLPALVMDVFHVGVIYQLIAFVVVSLICIIAVSKHPGTKSTDGFDSIVGMRCVVVERIDSEAGCGQVMVNGQSWSARAVDETATYEEGESLKVLAIEGVKLICTK